jgi:hypothetical protein
MNAYGVVEVKISLEEHEEKSRGQVKQDSSVGFNASC